jgi:gluconate kinase
MGELKKAYPKLCVAQALFKNKHRRMMLDLFPNTKFVWVKAETKIIRARLAKRAGREVGVYYAETVNRSFKQPAIRHRIWQTTMEEKK